jgi:glucose/arabinose dehydrogenase
MLRNLTTLAQRCTAGLLVAAMTGAPALGAGSVVLTEKAAVRVETITRGLEHPWGMAFLPDDLRNLRPWSGWRWTASALLTKRGY